MKERIEFYVIQQDRTQSFVDKGGRRFITWF